MTLTKMQAMLGVATGSLIVIGAIVDNGLTDERRFAALDTRLGKLESAIKTLNATTPDERYKQLVKELIAEERSQLVVGKKAGADGAHRFGIVFYPADEGAPADAPAVKVPQ